jgi:hypothetical protein
MLSLTRAIQEAEDGKPHNFIFITKGTAKNKRNGGYKVEMKNAVVTSSNYAEGKLNLRSIDSGQIRWCYYVLLIEFDSHEIIL